MSKEIILKSDLARKAFIDAGLGYENITIEDLRELRRLVAKRVSDSGLFDGTYQVWQRWKHVEFENGELYQAYLRCRAFYFEDRECISFNRDGFIGFCGWSDSKNDVPILDGFYDWLEYMKEQTA